MRAAIALVGLVSACSFAPDYNGTRYACNPAEPVCPPDQTCGRDGLCGVPGSPPPPPLAVDAQISQPLPDAPPGAQIVITFGERPNDDVRGVTSDTYIDSALPNDNFGTSSDASFDADPVRTALLRFDLSAAPAGAQVDGAELSIYVFDPLETGDCVIAPITEPWAAKEATYLLRTSMAPWSEPGGTVGQLVQVFTPRTAGEYTVTLPIALVQRWLDDPVSNLGVRFASTSLDGRGGQWSTCNENTSDRRPQLRLTLTTPP
jgi:hypothetical protein